MSRFAVRAPDPPLGRSLFAPPFQILNPPLFVENTVTRIVRELLVQISIVFVRSILARYCIDPVIE